MIENDELQIKYVKARKIWECNECEGEIEKDEKHVVISKKEWTIRRGKRGIWRDIIIKRLHRSCYLKNYDHLMPIRFKIAENDYDDHEELLKYIQNYFHEILHWEITEIQAEKIYYMMKAEEEEN